MYRQLIKTEFDANKIILLVWLLLNCAFFINMGYQQSPIYTYMGFSLVSFWVMITISASVAGHEKRVRLYAELPVTPRHSFIASWGFVLIWMFIQIIAWMLYGSLFEEEFDNAQAGSALIFGLGALIFTAIISIGIDLGAFKPRYVQWLYILLMAVLLAAALHSGISVGLLGTDTGIHFYPVSLLDNLMLEIVVSAGLALLLLVINYLIFCRSDSYLH